VFAAYPFSAAPYSAVGTIPVWTGTIPSQAPGYTEITPSQTPNYTEITPAQTPNWVWNDKPS